MEERVAGPGKRGTKLQGREGPTESLTRLGIGSDREEQERKTTLYNHVLISIPVLLYYVKYYEYGNHLYSIINARTVSSYSIIRQMWSNKGIWLIQE